jgi:hypothetical protein
VVAQASVILATQKVEIERITVQWQVRQKASKTPFQPVKAGFTSNHLPSQIFRDAQVGGPWSRLTSIKGDPTPKITKAKRVGQVA